MGIVPRFGGFEDEPVKPGYGVKLNFPALRTSLRLEKLRLTDAES